MLAEYWPILLFLVAATGLGLILLAVGTVLGPSVPTRESDPRTSAASKHSKTRA